MNGSKQALTDHAGRDARVQEDIKKRREERIRRLMAGSRLPDGADGGRADGRNEDWRAWAKPPTFRQYAAKWLLCLALYAAVWGLFRTDAPSLLPLKEAIRRSLTEPFGFDLAAEWYRRHIADLPALVPAFGGRKADAEAAYVAPVSGRVVLPDRTGREGVQLATPPESRVLAAAEGLVVRIEDAPDTGLTVTMRHRAGTETVYGWLKSVRVREHDWLEAGDVIGTVSDSPDGRSGRLYFAVRQNGRPVDPRDVIPLD